MSSSWGVAATCIGVVAEERFSSVFGLAVARAMFARICSEFQRRSRQPSWRGRCKCVVEVICLCGSSVGRSFDLIVVDDVPAKEVWRRLQSDPKAVLIDVRTRAEWAFVGMPDLTEIGRRPLLVEWLTFPDNRANPTFVEQLTQALADAGADKNSELYFICRSGGRSQQAAKAMVAVGFQHCHNVAEGFEGPLDGDRHRGVQTGWKVEGLPWVQG